MVRTTIKSSELLVDRPLEWNVYDASGDLMYARGSVIDEETKGRLLKRGVSRDIDSEIGKLVRQQTNIGEGLASDQAAYPPKEVRIPLSDTAVRPGDSMHIERILDGSRLTSRLIGYLKGKSIIITVPVDDQGGVFLKEGESITAKIFSGKHILTFPCSVLAAVTKPFAHIHLNFPGEVTGIVVRKSSRANVRIIAAMDVGSDQFSGIVSDISTGGASFATRAQHIQSGTMIMLNFKLDLAGCIYLMRLDCLVKAVRSHHAQVLEGAIVYGLQFTDLSAEDVIVLGMFVSQQQAEARNS